MSRCRVTSRHPATQNPSDPRFESDYVEGENQDYTIVTTKLQGVVDEVDDKGNIIYFANSLPEAVYRLLKPKNAKGEPSMKYTDFSTGSWKYGTVPTAYPSLEAIHNNLHMFAGGDGYLGDPATAAYDPLFWVHHCNVDRLLSIYQDLYPQAYKDWLNSNPTNHGPKTQLAPFLGQDGKYFTSHTVSGIHTKQGLNYTYPELQRWQYKTDKEYTDSIVATIERLYSATPKTSLLLKQNVKAREIQMANMTPLNLAVENFPPPLVEQLTQPLTLQSSETEDHAYGAPPKTLEWKNNDYVVNVVYERYVFRVQIRRGC